MENVGERLYQESQLDVDGTEEKNRPIRSLFIEVRENLEAKLSWCCCLLQGNKMFGEKALELIKELKRARDGSMSAFNVSEI